MLAQQLVPACTWVRVLTSIASMACFLPGNPHHQPALQDTRRLSPITTPTTTTTTTRPTLPDSLYCMHGHCLGWPWTRSSATLPSHTTTIKPTTPCECSYLLHAHSHCLPLAPMRHSPGPRKGHLLHYIITQEMTLRELEHQAHLQHTADTQGRAASKTDSQPTPQDWTRFFC